MFHLQLGNLLHDAVGNLLIALTSLRLEFIGCKSDRAGSHFPDPRGRASRAHPTGSLSPGCLHFVPAQPTPHDVNLTFRQRFSLSSPQGIFTPKSVRPAGRTQKNGVPPSNRRHATRNLKTL
jgi:hypothetical protein